MNEGPLRDVVKGIIKNLEKEATNITQDTIQKIWEDVVGKKFAGHSRPKTFKSKKLIVHVDTSSWLYELSLKKDAILKELKPKLKEKGLEEIQFRIGEL